MDNPANFDKAKTLKLAQMYFREGEWDKALAEQGKILAVDRNDPISLAAVGDIYAKKRSVQLAFEFYNKAIPFFFAQSRPEESLALYQKITKLDSTKLSLDVRMDMNIFKGYLEIDELLKDKRYEFAIVPLSKLLKLRPQDAMAQALTKALTAQIEKANPSAQRYQTLGDTFTRNGMLESSWEMYRKASEMDPQYLSVLPELAKTLHKQGHDNEAKKAYLYLAEKALASEDLNRTFDLAEKAAELKSLEAGYILGLVHFKRRSWLEAKTEFEKLLRVKVNHVGALTHLAKTHVSLKQPEKAKEHLLKALKIDEKNVLVQESWVEFCLQGPDKDAAIPQLAFLLDRAEAEQNAERTVHFSRLSIHIRPDLVSARIKLVQGLQAQGEFEEAADAARSLAAIYEQQGLLTESAEWLKKSNLMKPTGQMTNDIPVPFPTPSENMIPPEIPEISVDAAPEMIIPAEEERLEVPPVEPPPPIEPVQKAPSSSSPTERAQSKPASRPETVRQAPPPPIPIKRSPLDEFQEQLALAQVCIKQGLIKAAIDIYLQILEAKPELAEVRNRLNDANALYLKLWMEKKK